MNGTNSELSDESGILNDVAVDGAGADLLPGFGSGVITDNLDLLEFAGSFDRCQSSQG